MCIVRLQSLAIELLVDRTASLHGAALCAATENSILALQSYL